MSKPDIEPKATTAGITVDPKTLERVIPESKRPDGSVRKQLRVRPGFTPQEDVSRFRGSRQQQHDRIQLPKGHILGWVAPSSETAKKRSNSASNSPAGGDGGEKPVTKSAAKNAKRKAKKQAEKDKAIREAWDEDSDEEKEKAKSSTAKGRTKTQSSDDTKGDKGSVEGSGNNTVTRDETKETAAKSGEGDALAEELEKKLDVH